MPVYGQRNKRMSSLSRTLNGGERERKKETPWVSRWTVKGYRIGLNFFQLHFNRTERERKTQFFVAESFVYLHLINASSGHLLFDDEDEKQAGEFFFSLARRQFHGGEEECNQSFQLNRTCSRRAMPEKEITRPYLGFAEQILSSVVLEKN